MRLWSRRARRERGPRFERFMFSIMGPAQLGEDKPAEGYVADPAAEVCHRCGSTWDAHERVHTGSLTYRRCPGQ